MTHIYISVHPVSHRLEWRGWGGDSTALSARYDGWAGLYDEHGQHTIVLIEYD